MDKYNFTTKMYAACSNDELRPIANCVHFENGFILASNGIIAIRQSLEYHSILSPELLDGNSLHRENYKNIMQFEEAIATQEGIHCKNKDGRIAFFEYFDRKKEKIPNFDEIFKKYKAKGVDFIGFNPEQMRILMLSLYCPGGYVRVNFGGIDKIMFIDVPGIERQEAILMPVLVEGTLF